MALIKKNAEASTNAAATEEVTKPQFEIVDDEVGDEQEDAIELARREAAENDRKNAEAEAKAKAAEAKPSASREVATQKPNAGALASPIAQKDPFKVAENALTVKFNTFPQIQAKQGQFFAADGNKKLGETLVVQLVSFQKQWQVAPGDIDSPQSKQFLRYGDNPTFAENGDNMDDVVKLAHAAGFTKAKKQERLLMVVRLIDAGKEQSLNKKIVQLDLAPSSVAGFTRHRLNIAFQIAENELPEGAKPELMKLTAVPKEQNKMSWTEIEFEQA